jgi:hypothetical protein
VVGVEAKKLFDDANKLLQEVIDKKLLRANAVVGFWPANAVGDDIVLYDYEEQTVETSCDKHGVHTALRYNLKAMNGSSARWPPSTRSTPSTRSAPRSTSCASRARRRLRCPTCRWPTSLRPSKRARPTTSAPLP